MTDSKPNAAETATPDLARLDAALVEAKLAADAAETRLARLLGTIYENGDKALRVVTTMLPTRGIEGVMALVERREPWWQRSALTRIGFERGAWLSSHSRRGDVRQAKQELPEALRELLAVRGRVQDLHTMRERAAQTAWDRAQQAERERARPRPDRSEGRTGGPSGGRTG